MQTDAETTVVYSSIWISVNMLFLLGTMVLPLRKNKQTAQSVHTAGLSIAWKVLVCIQVLAGILHVILVPSVAVTVPAQRLRATASEVAG